MWCAIYRAYDDLDKLLLSISFQILKNFENIVSTKIFMVPFCAFHRSKKIKLSQKPNLPPFYFRIHQTNPDKYPTGVAQWLDFYFRLSLDTFNPHNLFAYRKHESWTAISQIPFHARLPQPLASTTGQHRRVCYVHIYIFFNFGDPIDIRTFDFRFPRRLLRSLLRICTVAGPNQTCPIGVCGCCREAGNIPLTPTRRKGGRG